MLDVILNLLSDEVLKLVIPGLALGVGYLLRLIFKDKAAAKSKLFEMGVGIAYNIVNDLAARSPNKVDDKVALALGFLAEYLKTNGQEMTDADAEKAKLLFAAMHGREKAIMAGKPVP